MNKTAAAAIGGAVLAGVITIIIVAPILVLTDFSRAWFADGDFVQMPDFVGDPIPGTWGKTFFHSAHGDSFVLMMMPAKHQMRRGTHYIQVEDPDNPGVENRDFWWATNPTMFPAVAGSLDWWLSSVNPDTVLAWGDWILPVDSDCFRITKRSP